MLRKLASALFSRWTLLVLLLAALVAVLWIIGPLVAVGNSRPFDSTLARWVATAVLLGGAAAWAVWRVVLARRGNRRVVEQLAAAPAAEKGAPESADLIAVRERFGKALTTLRNARFGASAEGGATAGWQRTLQNKLSGRYLYQLPWYLIIGAPGSGKTTALQNAGLQFPLAASHGDKGVRGVGGTRLCDWWFTDRAVLIDTAGRFTTQDSDAEGDKATWGGFLALLKRSRPRQPLNGVLVTVSVSDLIGKSAAERAMHAQAVRQRVQELHEQLRIRFPIYLLVSKCDLLAGFAEMFATLDKDQRATPWGFTFPLQAAGAPGERMGPEFDALLNRLDQGLIDRLQAEGDGQRRAPIYGFPNQFVNLKAPLAEFVDQVFAPSPFEADPLLRGVYFVSGTQEGTPIDRVLGSVARRYRIEQSLLPPQRASGRSFFLQRLLTDVVFAEQNLSGTDRGWERRRGNLALAGYVGLGLLTAGVLGTWFTSWRNNGQYIDTVAARVEAVRQQVQATPNRASPDLLPLLPALEATRGLAAAGGSGAVGGASAGAGAGAAAGPAGGTLATERTAADSARVPWSLGFGLYQGKKLDGAARGAYERMLADAMLPRLALRVEEQLRGQDQPESLYEALKAYVMMYDPEHFEADALKAHIENDWDLRLGRDLAPEQRDALGRHLGALLEQGPVVSPVKQDQGLIDATRTRLSAVPLPQRVYSRLRQRGLSTQFPELSVVAAGGATVQNVFVRQSGQPLTRGVPGLFTYDGYHKGFQSVVGEAAKTLAAEQTWVLGVAPAQAQGTEALLASGRLTDDVRRLYLNDYRDTWKAFMADIRLQPLGGMAQAIERTRFLSGPDNPLVPMLKRFSRETTLLAAAPGATGAASQKVQEVISDARKRVLGAVDAKPGTTGAPGERIESIVDDEFKSLRGMVTAPEGGKPPIEGLVARLQDLQVLLTSADAAVKGGAAPPPSSLPTELKVQAANAPEPVRAILETLGSASSRVALIQLRESLSREVRSSVGEFCQQAIGGRYPFDSSSPREVTPADFAALFGPGGRFEQMQNKLAAYIDTSTRPWRFRPIDGAPLGSDVGSLPQFQRAQAIREAFFAAGGNVPGVRMMIKPVEMDRSLTEFLLDADGQILRYDHGPQIPVDIKWPGPRGSGVVRVSAQPAGITGMSAEGPWALFRLFERVNIVPGNSPEKFRATFDVGGRKASFDVATSSVKNPLRLPELRSFQCPQGL